MKLNNMCEFTKEDLENICDAMNLWNSKHIMKSMIDTHMKAEFMHRNINEKPYYDCPTCGRKTIGNDDE